MRKVRMNRASYWTAMGAVLAVLFVLNSLGLPPGLMELALLALGIPRLHDAGHSGWWLAGLFGGQAAMIGLAVYFGREWRPGSEIALLLAGTYWIAVIIVGTIPGQRRANRWGAPPRAGISLAR